MIFVKIAAAILIGSTYLMLHWSLYMNSRRFHHWTLADSIETTFPTRIALREFWTKMAIALIAIDVILAIAAFSQGWQASIVVPLLFFLYKLSAMETLYRHD
jgi:hypothetical protein